MIESSMYESRQTNFRIFGIVITLAGTLLALSPFAAAVEEKDNLPEGTSKSSTPNPELYEQFAGGRGRMEWSGNALKMKFVWCRLGHFEIGPFQKVNGKVVNENQAEEDLFRQIERQDRVVPNASEQAMPDTTIVFLSHGFWLGQYEVTRKDWKQIMETMPWEGRKLFIEGDDFPATYISWNGAMEFCRVLTARERAAGRLPRGWEYTLPTEAQWERACRAGTTTPYSFGSDEARLPDYAWYGTDGGHPQRVGQKDPNPWGLYDMHGNVLEWCRDLDNRKPHPGGRDPEVTEGRHRVQRGGHFASRASACRSSARNMEPAELKKLQFGFRVALRYVD